MENGAAISAGQAVWPSSDTDDLIEIVQSVPSPSQPLQVASSSSPTQVANPKAEPMELSLKRPHDDTEQDEQSEVKAEDGDNDEANDDDSFIMVNCQTETKRVKRETTPASATAASSSSMLKNSIQLLYEIKSIQPSIRFDTVGQHGPSHAPTFAMSVSFTLSGRTLTFEGQGATKKQAKSRASIVALAHLLAEMSDEAQIGPLNAAYIRWLLDVESRSQPVVVDPLTLPQKQQQQQQQQQQIKRQKDEDGDDDSSADNEMDVQQRESSSSSSSVPLVVFTSGSELLKHERDVDDEDSAMAIASASEQVRTLSVKTTCRKSQATQPATNNRGNPLMLVNQLIANEWRSFELVQDVTSGQQQHQKQQQQRTFKFALRINKRAAAHVSHVDESPLVVRTDDEWIFYGEALNKQQAKTRAAQLALTHLFNQYPQSQQQQQQQEQHQQQLQQHEHDQQQQHATSFDTTSATCQQDHEAATFRPFADTIAHLVRDKYDEVLKTLAVQPVTDQAASALVASSVETPPATTASTSKTAQKAAITNELVKMRNVYAGIVQTRDLDPNTCELIALASGTKCIGGEEMSLDGESINDWYVQQHT